MTTERHYAQMFEHHWDNPPAPFNPDADPLARWRSDRVEASLYDDDFEILNPSRPQRAEERKRRYAALEIEDRENGVTAVPANWKGQLCREAMERFDERHNITI